MGRRGGQEGSVEACCSHRNRKRAVEVHESGEASGHALEIEKGGGGKTGPRPEHQSVWREVRGLGNVQHRRKEGLIKRGNFLQRGNLEIR